MKRYENNYGAMDDATDGEWVKYEDANARIEELEEEIFNLGCELKERD